MKRDFLQLTLVEGTGPKVLSVAELTGAIKAALTEEPRFRGVWVRGEVSGAKGSPRGHLFFTLKDESAQLSCVMFGYQSRPGSERIKDGAALLVHGDVDVYEARGAYNLKADAVMPVGTGDLHLEYLRRKAALEAEGLFRPELKRPLPEYPARIGVVTSMHGAAVRDIFRVFARRYPLVELYVSSAAVQGDECPKSVVAALGRLAAVPALNAVIVARGGGSLEDLFGFNDESVVRAIRAFPVPVVTGIGHETDTTLSDLASDLRAATPTAAAEALAPDMADVSRTMWGQVERMAAALQHSVENRQLRLDGLAEALSGRMDAALQARRDALGRLEGVLCALSPQAVLERGFAIVQAPSGAVVSSVGQASVDDRLAVRLSDGRLDVEVKGIERKRNG